jgi:hypothetical protein
VRATPALAAALALVAGPLVGCGIEPESEARTLDPETVPFGLLEPEEEPPAPPSVNGADGTAVEAFFVTDGELTSVARRVPDAGEFDVLVDLLVEGPTERESDGGLRTSLSNGQVDGVVTSRGTASVDLTDAFSELSQEDRAAAIAQLVFTLTARPGIGRVGFTLESEPIEVPRGDGTLTADSLARDDFPDRSPGEP